MRVLFIACNRERLPDPVPCIGAAFVAGAAREAGHDVRILDLCFEEDPAAAVRRVVRELEPGVIAVSIRNVDAFGHSGSNPYLDLYRATFALLREVSRALIVAGGSGFSLMPGPFMKELGPDCGIVGEGERAFLRCLEAMENGQSLETIPGLCLIKDGRLVCNAPERIVDLGEVVEPCWEGVDLHRYLREGGMINIQTARGCNRHCIYCPYPVIEGDAIRTRDPGEVADEMKRMFALGLTHSFIVDSAFNLDPAHAFRVCEALERSGFQGQWSCYANPVGFSLELARAMRLAGCTSVEFGVDSGADEVLDALNKGFSAGDIETASEAARRAGLLQCHTLLLGGPGETEATLRKTADLMDRIGQDAVIVMSGIRIYPGTLMARFAEKEGRSPESWNGFNAASYVSLQVSHMLSGWIRRETKARGHWIAPEIGIRYSEKLQRNFRKRGVRGPLWEQISKWRNA